MKSLVVVALSGLLTLLSTFATAAEVPFNQAKFDAARISGAPLAVVFHADWCPTCRAQAPVKKF